MHIYIQDKGNSKNIFRLLYIQISICHGNILT